MTKEEFNFIKDAFSQIIDDIAGNPDWHDAASAIASNLGTLERELEKKTIFLLSNLDEAAECYSNINENYACWIEGGLTAEDADDQELIKKAFKAGAVWMAGQGETQEHFIIGSIAGTPCGPAVVCYTEEFADGDEVIVQIRKK